MMVDKSGVGPDGDAGGGGVTAVSESKGESGEDEGGSDDGPIQTQESISSGGQRTKSNQRWMKLRTTVQLSGAITSTIQKTKPTLKREDSFLKRFSTRQGPENQETMDTGDDGESQSGATEYLRRYKRHFRHNTHPRTVVNPDEDFYFYWLLILSVCVLYNLWTLIVRQSFPELQLIIANVWFKCDIFVDFIYLMDIAVQIRTGYLEQGLMVYDSRKLAGHYIKSKSFLFDLGSLLPLDLLQINFGVNPMLRFPRFLKVYRIYDYYYMVESRTVYPNLWRVINLIHILLILAHWFGCFYYLLSEAEDFRGDWVYPYRAGDYATLTRKYLGSLYWSTLTLTTIGDLPSPETNADKSSTDGFQYQATRGHKSRLLRIKSTKGYVFTIVSYLIGVFIFATIVGQVGNVITNRNANRLEFERLLDGAKTYMRHHKVPGGMKRRVLRWYDYSWSRGRIQGGGDINTALGLLPDKLKTELALHVNLSVLKKVTIFHECQPEFLHDLVLKMKAYIFTPGDLICRKGEVAREMFIIADGILEVKSETGRVLTTMKAGDFFGEIGILNLDGLNKRTADVRSVGYSELFSLSREDVLAAMKDYPEAEEILQTLGRKRLMDAARIMRGDKTGSESGKNATSTSPEFFDNLTGKRIVQKIRSDVIGLKNVLRKSRRRARSKDDSIELQPLTQIYTSGPSSGKGILRRMSRVWSDDTSQEDEISPPESKIGAGLPLLQRIKLLGEKIENDKQGASTSGHVTIKKEEPEVIGAGLPLLQRLLLLKQKEDKEAVVVKNTVNQTAEILVSTVRTQHKSPPSSFSKSKKLLEDGDKALKPNIMSIKKVITSGKSENVSWKNSEVLNKEITTDEESNNSCKEDIVAKETSLKLGVKNEYPTKCKSLLKKSTWSTIKKATMVQKVEDKTEKTTTIIHPESSTTTCSTNLSKNALPESILLPGYVTVGPLISELSESNQIHFLHNGSELSTSSTENKQELGVPKLSDVNIVMTNSGRGDITKQVLNSKTNFDKIGSNIDRVKINNNSKHLVTNNSSLIISDKECSDKIKPSFKTINKTKMYRSIEDLLPECSGVPLAKGLKIFNEHKKCAMFENNCSRRRSSLDSGDSKYNSNINSEHDSSRLTRSSSETIVFEIIHRNQLSRRDQNQYSIVTKENSPPSLTSPESNETAERQNLKSILKKLSSGSLASCLDEKTPQSLDPSTHLLKKPSSIELRKLMRAQTVEGYIARHSKLTKSVTFNRDTLQSPPNLNSLNSVFRFSFPLHPDISQNSKSLDSNTSITVPHIPLIKSSTSHEFPIKTGMDTETTTSDDETDSDFPQTLLNTQFQTFQNVTKEAKTSVASKKSTHTNWIEPPESKQKNFFRPGSILLPSQNSQEDECFGGVLGGIKFLIQQHLEEVQSKFSQRFQDLEIEVKKRDDIIEMLQQHIRELEHLLNEDASSTKSDDIDPPFVRGISVDTVIQSPLRRERQLSSKNRESWEDRSEEENLELMDLPQSMTPQPIWDYTSIDMGSVTSGSDEGNDHTFKPFGKRNQDWEIQQLAEEFTKRETLKTSNRRERFLSSKDRTGFLNRRAISFDTVGHDSGWRARSLDYPEAETSGEVFRRTLFP